MAEVWSLSQAQRDDTVQRVTANIFTMGFIKGLPIDDDTAQKAAVYFEGKAYTAAEVAARTTTGNRPISETTRAYARFVQLKSSLNWGHCAGWVGIRLGPTSRPQPCRKLSELVIEMIKNGGVFHEGEAAATAGSSEVRHASKHALRSQPSSVSAPRLVLMHSFILHVAHCIFDDL